MPLFTDDIERARLAYNALEFRALSAEQRAQNLQATIDDLRARQPISAEQAALLRRHAIDREAENVKLQLQVQQVARIKTDLSLDNFIAALGLAAAIGEASMPDRAIASMATTVQAYIAVSNGGVGLRFHQPELSTFTGLSSTSLEIAKVPPQPGVAAPRNLYAVLEGKQHVYTDPFWARFGPAIQIIAEMTKVLANTETWSFPFLVQSAAAIAQLEKSLAPLIAAAAPAEKATAYSAAVDSLLSLTRALGAKAIPVAGDLLALSAALDATTGAARSFLP